MATDSELSDPSMTRVVVVDDQALVRSGLCMILDAQDDIEVVGEASDGREAIDLVRALQPDVVLMDVRMPILDGIAATEAIASDQHAPRIIVLTTYGLDENVYAALRAGAAGFFLKTDPPEKLIDAVRAAGSADAQLGPDVIQLLLDRFLAGPPPVRPEPAEFVTLTERETEVMLLVGQGLTNRDIADRLYVGEGTVKTHVARILTKTGLRDRIQVVVYCYEHGLLRPGDASAAP